MYTLCTYIWLQSHIVCMQCSLGVNSLLCAVIMHYFFKSTVYKELRLRIPISLRIVS